MHSKTSQYTPEEVDCKNCTEYDRKMGCTAKTCPWLAERISAGVVDYEKAVLETFSRSPHLCARLHTVIRRYTGSLFFIPRHRQRMEFAQVREGSHYRRDTPAYFAAMYLLTANEELYSRTEKCFGRHSIEFDRANLRNISPHNYTLFSAARDIYTDSTSITVSDLANAEIVDIIAFSLIVNALLVARYGCAVLKINIMEENI